MDGHLQLLPAVDVMGGRAVQLAQGKAGSQRVYGEPLEAALNWQRCGAEWIHLADLDAAFGHGHNRATLEEIVRQLDIHVQVSGGIADDESLHVALATGCRRVVIAAGALSSPEWCAQAVAQHGDRVAIGLDVRGRVVTPRGGTRELGQLDEVLGRLDAAGSARYVVTDVDRDGMLHGPNLDLLQHVCAATAAPVVASGGITTLADVVAVKSLVGAGVEGVIVGTALHEGRFTLEDALTVA